MVCLGREKYCLGTYSVMVPHKKAHPILLQQQSHMQAGMYVSKQSRKQAIRHMLHKATITTQTIVLDDNCLRGASY